VPVVERNGLRFHVQELGEEGPPVVFVHGLLENMATWYFTAAPEVARSHRVLLFDQRGHGRSEPAGTGYGVAALAADLAAHVEAFAPGERVSLVGSSLGGTVVLRYAADRPDRVDRLALVDAPLPALAGSELGWLAQAEEADIFALLPTDARRYFTDHGRRRNGIVQHARSFAFETTVVAELEADPDVADDELARIDRPVLLLYGDRSFNRDARDRLLRVLPDGRAVDVPAGHFIALEAATEMTSALTEFLRG
jgi:pimeloyl-ACP methyl ester carboxylesterase